jgi:hypothetical protein
MASKSKSIHSLVSTAASISQSKKTLNGLQSQRNPSCNILTLRKMEDREEDRKFLEKHRKKMDKLQDFQIKSKKIQKVQFQLHQEYLGSIISGH